MELSVETTGITGLFKFALILSSSLLSLLMLRHQDDTASEQVSFPVRMQRCQLRADSTCRLDFLPVFKEGLGWCHWSTTSCVPWVNFPRSDDVFVMAWFAHFHLGQKTCISDMAGWWKESSVWTWGQEKQKNPREASDAQISPMNTNLSSAELI